MDANLNMDGLDEIDKNIDTKYNVNEAKIYWMQIGQII